MITLVVSLTLLGALKRALAFLDSCGSLVVSESGADRERVSSNSTSQSRLFSFCSHHG